MGTCQLSWMMSDVRVTRAGSLTVATRPGKAPTVPIQRMLDSYAEVWLSSMDLFSDVMMM